MPSSEAHMHGIVIRYVAPWMPCFVVQSPQSLVSHSAPSQHLSARPCRSTAAAVPPGLASPRHEEPTLW
ncbi:hypothetical protein [Microtetraspora malaysiensis]|uniref:hypothetical protein n=1 Tax=Microtetraspora malaysiensis TaxID=161358 RepID=UPI003D91E9C0